MYERLETVQVLAFVLLVGVVALFAASSFAICVSSVHLSIPVDAILSFATQVFSFAAFVAAAFVWGALLALTWHSKARFVEALLALFLAPLFLVALGIPPCVWQYFLLVEGILMIMYMFV